VLEGIDYGREIYTSVLRLCVVGLGCPRPMPVLVLGIRRRAGKRGTCSPVRTVSDVSSSSSSEVSLTLVNGRSSSGRISFGFGVCSRTRFGGDDIKPATAENPPQPSSTSSASARVRSSEIGISTGLNQRFDP
jgi:hypothetical protein